MRAASVAISCWTAAGGGHRPPPAVRLCRCSLALHEAELGRDRLHERLLLALDLVDGDDSERGVAVLVDLEVPEDPVLDLSIQDLFRDRGAGSVGLLDRVEHDRGGLRGVGGVRVWRLSDLGRELIDEGLARALELVSREARLR